MSKRKTPDTKVNENPAPKKQTIVEQSQRLFYVSDGKKSEWFYSGVISASKVLTEVANAYCDGELTKKNGRFLAIVELEEKDVPLHAWGVISDLFRGLTLRPETKICADDILYIANKYDIKLPIRSWAVFFKCNVRPFIKITEKVCCPMYYDLIVEHMGRLYLHSDINAMKFTYTMGFQMQSEIILASHKYLLCGASSREKKHLKNTFDARVEQVREFAAKWKKRYTEHQAKLKANTKRQAEAKK